MTVLLLPGRELWLGFDRVLVDQGMAKENVTKLLIRYINNLSGWHYFSYVYFVSIQQYSSTNARNDGYFRVERDTFLSEYLWHNDCSAIRLITPAGSNMLCAVSIVVLALYEMECLKPLNPTMVICTIPRDFPLYF